MFGNFCTGVAVLPPLAGRSVQRDLFPLPAFRSSDPGHFGTHLPPGGRRRATACDKWVSAANRGITALNQIMGLNNFSEHAVSEAQGLALQEIKAAYRPHECAQSSVGEPPTGEAIRELCGSSSSYTGERADIRPFAEESISWPCSGSSPVALGAL